MSFFDREIFRVDEEALRKDNQAELKNTISRVLQLQELQQSRDVIDEPIPITESFPLMHKTRQFSANESRVLLLNIDVPRNRIGFLQSIGTSILLTSPNSWYEIWIDDQPIKGYTEADGRITRQIGEHLQPEVLNPPIIFHRHARFYASNEDNDTATTIALGYTINGVFMEKPPFHNNDVIVTPDAVSRLIRGE